MPIADIDYREYFTQEKLDGLHDAFKKFDSDDNGQIDQGELYAMFKKLGYKLTRNQLREVQKEVGFDGSGEIEFEELCVLEIKMSRARPRADLIDYRAYLEDSAVRQLETFFVQQDTVQKGTIGLTELGRILESLECKVPQQEISRVLGQVDLNVDGELDFDKLCALWAVLLKGRKRINYREFLSPKEVENLRRMFEAADSRGEGSLTGAEFGHLLKKLGMTLKKDQLTTLMKRVDTDGSGDIDFEEFCNMIVRLRQLRRKRVISPETCSCSELWFEERFGVRELMRSGFSLNEFRKVGIPVGKIYTEGGASALDLRRAGYSAAELRRAGVGVKDLRNCGFSLTDLRNAGFSSGALTETNRMMHTSFSTGDLSMLPQQRPKDVMNTGVTTPQSKGGLGSLPLISAGASLGGLQSWQIPPRQMTPQIREHTDWRPKLRRSKSQALGVAGADIIIGIPEGQCAMIDEFPAGPR